MEFEDSVRALEESASRPVTAPVELVEDVSDWVQRLELLQREADLLAEQGLPGREASADPQAGRPR